MRTYGKWSAYAAMGASKYCKDLIMLEVQKIVLWIKNYNKYQRELKKLQLCTKNQAVRIDKMLKSLNGKKIETQK